MSVTFGADSLLVPRSGGSLIEPPAITGDWEVNLRVKLGLLAVVVAMLAAACGGSYDREAAIDDFVAEAGISRAQAECIVDGAEAAFGIERLESRGDLTAEEEDIVVGLTIDCVFSDGSGTDTAASTDSSGAGTETAAAPATLFSATDFEPACRGVEPVPRTCSG